MTVVSVVSDLHLEFSDTELPGGDILLLCGDIFVARHLEDTVSLERKWRYERFCREELSKYEKVLKVAGNHTYYRSSIEKAPGLIRKLFTECAPHAQLLDNEWVEINGVRFIGSTLWAPCGYGTAYHMAIQDGLNDFSLIRTTHPSIAFKQDDPEAAYSFDGPTDDRRFFVADAHRLHQEALGFLREAVQTELPCVILTHHAPTFFAKNSKRYPGQELDEAYFSNQHAFIESNPHIKLWGCGHSHYRFRAQIGEVKVTANPRGYYPNERMSHGFDPREADFDLATMEFVA